MLTVENLEVVYNDVVLVLRGISLEVPDNQIVALLGANGAGKTTTLRAITGLLDLHDGDVTKGEITFSGNAITGGLPSKIVKNGISQVMEGRRVFAELTIDENLRAGAYVNGNRSAYSSSYDRVMTLFPMLKERRGTAAGYLSGGEQQMLAIGRALMTNPRLLVLDEATEGLAPLIREKIWAALADIRKSGLSILLVDKNLKDLLKLADRHFIVEKGQVVWSGTSAQLSKAEDVQKRYLGV